MPKNYSEPQEIKKSLALRINQVQERKGDPRAALTKLPAGVQAWVKPIIEYAISRGLWKDPKETEIPAAWALAAITYLVDHEASDFKADCAKLLNKQEP